MSSNGSANLWLGVGAVALLGVGTYFLLRPNGEKAQAAPAGGGGAKLGLGEDGGSSTMFPGFDLGSVFGGGATNAVPGFDLGSTFGGRGPSAAVKSDAQAASSARTLGLVDGHRAMGKLLAELKVKSPVTSAGYMQRYHVAAQASLAERVRLKQIDDTIPGVADKYEEGFLKGAEDAMRNANYRSTLFQEESPTQAFPKILIAYHPTGAVLPPPPGFVVAPEELVDERYKNVSNAIANSPYLHTLAIAYYGLV